MIEDHYYIKNLINEQEKRSNERTRIKTQLKQREERSELINDSKDIDIKDFWCDKCKKDFISRTHKQTETDWNNSNQKIAFYKTKHKCGKWCIRFISDKLKDPYWEKSTFVGRDRSNNLKDLIQPFQSGFNLLYGKK